MCVLIRQARAEAGHLREIDGFLQVDCEQSSPLGVHPHVAMHIATVGVHLRKSLPQLPDAGGCAEALPHVLLYKVSVT